MRKLLIIIFILATILRLYKLDLIPALNADEAAIGYNAYSLLLTGKDEHGNQWPLHFQSFNDYKPGLYFYVVLPFVWLWGLNEWSVRLPGAALGVLTVIVLYFLVKEIFPTKKYLPILSSLFLAISPWHIHFSRGGWEVSAATFFITAGVYAFYKALSNKKWLLVSVLLFVSSAYTYHAARIIVPLLGLGLFVLHREILIRKPRELIQAAILSVVLLIPLLVSVFMGNAYSRASGVGLFADPGPVNRVNEQRGEHRGLKDPISLFYHNKAVNYSLAFWQNYTDHFFGEFLFLSGDEIQRNKVPEVGQMYLLDLVFLSFGLFLIARNAKVWSGFLLWLLIAPLAAGLTFQTPHALRAQNMVIPLTVVSAYGVLGLLELLGKIIKFRPLLFTGYCLLITVYFWDFTRYLHQYWVHLAKTYDFSSQYGTKELVRYAQENYDKTDEFVITKRYDQPYILFLFYLSYPPEKFQKEHTLTQADEFGFSTVDEFGKFKFTNFGMWDRVREAYPGAYIAGAPGEIPHGTNVVKEIAFPSGRVAYKIVKN